MKAYTFNVYMPEVYHSYIQGKAGIMANILPMNSLILNLKALTQHSGFIKYLKNSGWMFSTRVISLVLSFIVTTYIARYLGPYNYGQLSYAVSFVGIFSFLSSLGIDSVLYRELISFKDRRSEYMGTALILKLFAGLFALTLTVSAAYLSNLSGVGLLIIILISFTFIFNSFNIIAYEFQADVDGKITSIISIAVTCVLSLLKIGVVVFEKGLIYLASVLLFESLLYATLYIYFRLKKYGSITSWSYNPQVARSLIHDSWPMMFTAAFSVIYARIDQIFIKSLINIESVGIYDAAVRLSEVWYFIPNIVLSSLFPAIMNSKMDNATTYFKRQKYLFLLMLGLSTSISIFVTIFAKEITLIVFGSAFISSYIILQVYIWSLVGTYMNHAISHFLIAENYRKMIFTSSLFGMVTNIILNIVLIPMYGILGAAIATVVSYTLGPVFLFVFKDFRSKMKQIIS